MRPVLGIWQRSAARTKERSTSPLAHGSSRAQTCAAMTSCVPARFPIRFDSLYGLLSKALFMSPDDSFVDVTDRDVAVRMGIGFRATFPRSAITGTKLVSREPLSRGVHGMFGRWLVNGSGKGLATISLEPPQRGYVCGVPVRISELTISLKSPETLVNILANPS